VKCNGFASSSSEEIAYCVITTGPRRSDEQAKSGQRSWIKAAIYLVLMGDDDFRPALSVEFVKKSEEH
jgi:hypothetical protein